MAAPVLAHRLMLTGEAVAAGRDASSLVQDLLSRITVPRSPVPTPRIR